MKTHLSHILPVHVACEILGEETVTRIGSSLLRLREHATQTQNQNQQQQQQSSLLLSHGTTRNTTLNNNNQTTTEEKDMQVLVQALFFPPPSTRMVDPLEDPSGHQQQQEANMVPPHIIVGWKRWLNWKVLALDKPTLLPFLIPHAVQPNSAGHMGLFDCLIYSLQGRATTSSTSGASGAAYYGGGSTSTSSSTNSNAPNYTNSSINSNPNAVLVPDVIILLAICKQYRMYRQNFAHEKTKQRQQQQQQQHDLLLEDGTMDSSSSQRRVVVKDDEGGNNTRKQQTLLTMAHLSYRIYDSYLKKGVVTRDTIHRFMTDIYGDDSYKEPEAAAVLDAIFYTGGGGDIGNYNNNGTSASSSSPLTAAITEDQFCKRCLDTIRRDDDSHLLLDWVAILGTAMLPLESIPTSIVAYFDTMNATRPPLCEIYKLADNRIFEIKRRFHSMVQQQNILSPIILKGDPMSSGSAAAPDVGDGNNNNSNSSSPQHHARQVITEAAFCHAVTSDNEEMGTGGYLPKKLAHLVFQANCRNAPGVVGVSSSTNSPSNTHPRGWGLYNVLEFGCLAVRHESIKKEEPELQLLRFLFTTFQVDDRNGDDNTSEQFSDQGLVFNGGDSDERILTRTQVAHMLVHLVEHVDFRRRADRSPLDDDHDEDNDAGEKTSEDVSLENKSVSLETAFFLGLVKPPEGSKPTDLVLLRDLVDAAMTNVSVKGQMTFEEFCAWHRASDDIRRTRLGPLMQELRLIAAVQFGIPPTLASMEVSLIAEIDRRHKRRYPPSETSRRGPRSTVLNIIDAAWLKGWTQLLKKVAGTAEDPNDGRDDPRSDRVRGLPRINNAGLLVENGSLSLRQDLRWKHDYELVPPLAWSAFQAWYDGGPPIHRTVVKYVPNSGTTPHSHHNAMPTENEIELYPCFVTVYLCDAASRGEARPFQQNFQLSRVSPIFVMLVQLCKELDVDPDSARLWVMGSGSNSNHSSIRTGITGLEGPASLEEKASEDWILSLEQNIADQRKRRGASHDENITLLLELKDRETGLWPRGADGKDWAFRDKPFSEQMPTDLGDGIVGMYNMGNTCYLNTSVQCLSHTPILREYFTSKAFYKDINRTNPLGYEGRLAQVSAVLINELWKRSNQVTPHQPKRVTAPQSYTLLTNVPALTPKTFKESLGKVNDIFAGNEQHDAQELLAFLLGGLSEDLNRIVEKPYMEAPDSDGRPDGELADIWWSNHLKREMSIIVALFTGQYKSLLTCRTCKYESARFEPFSFLQLPLPEDEHLSASLTLYPTKEGAPPMKYCVRVRNDGTLRDILVALAKILIQDETEEQGKAIEVSSGDEGGNLDIISARKADDLTVVVMREGYISRLAHSSWLLQDQQNKESGELPPLHIYELDPVTSNNEDPVDDGYDDEDKEENPSNVNALPSYICVAQRRSELVSRDFLHPLAHRVFGIPLLLRMNDLSSFTGRQLYDLVASRLKGVVPKAAVRFLANPNDGTAAKQPKVLAEAEGQLDKTTPASHHTSTSRTTTDMEAVSAGPVPRYGFRLRITSRDGRRCNRCTWYECCIGCLIPDNDDGPAPVQDGDSIVVDWHFAVDVATNGFGFRVNNSGDSIFANQPPPSRIRVSPVQIKSHSSCGTGPKKGTQPGAVTLEECLDSFAKEEKIPEAYCSRCRDFRVQTKRMSLWRLPPVMIIHLKRFQFTQTMRRKLRDLVVFPTEGLDLSRIMAPDSVAAAADHAKENGGTESKDGQTFETNNGDVQPDELKDDGRSEMLYDLYGVIHHQGALSGGHYVASLKSEIDGQWRLFNDAQIYEIHARDVVDPSAYILFYIRRDVAKAQLSDFWDVREGTGLSDEDMDQLMKGRSDRCVIS